MAEQARVEDVEALVEFETFLGRFREDLMSQCDALKVEYQRVAQGLHSEAPAYWRQALNRAEQRFAEARDALTMCRAKVRPDDHESCSEQQKAFEKARARLRLCEEKMKRLKACQLAWDQFASQNLPTLAETVDLADSRLPQAKARLASILDLLEKYRTG
jgi:hypothetical protein